MMRSPPTTSSTIEPPGSLRRLLFVVERFAPDLGGVARSAARTVDVLAAAGVEVHVLAWTRALPAGALETTVRPSTPRRAEVIVHRLGLFGNLDFSLQHTLTLLEDWHERSPFDAVWGHYLFPAGFLAVLFAETVGIRSTISARGNDVDMLMFPPGDFARLRWTLERADLITAVSRDLARKIHLLLGTPAAVHVVANSVDPTIFRPGAADSDLRQALGIADDETVLGFSGELRHKKGLPYLLSGLVEVRRERPACLLVIGEVRVRDQAALSVFAVEQPEAARRIIVTGHLEDPSAVARHLRLCDVFWHPSVWDGMPNAVLEALACGNLVLASDAGGIAEVIEHGTSGFIVRRAELHRFGEATLELLALPAATRAAIGSAAQQRIMTEFSPDQEDATLRAVWQALGQLGNEAPRD